MSFEHQLREWVDDSTFLSDDPRRIELDAFRKRDGRWLFPALAVPVGTEDELVCPPEHVAFLRQELDDADGLDLLVIGYSANDQAVIELLAATATPLRSLMVVDSDGERAFDVGQQLCDAFCQTDRVPFARHQIAGFNDLVQSRALRSYIERVERGRATPPGRWPVTLPRLVSGAGPRAKFF